MIMVFDVMVVVVKVAKQGASYNATLTTNQFLLALFGLSQ